MRKIAIYSSFHIICEYVNFNSKIRINQIQFSFKDFEKENMINILG